MPLTPKGNKKADDVYARGFLDKCAELGVDPEELLKIGKGGMIKKVVGVGKKLIEGGKKAIKKPVHLDSVGKKVVKGGKKLKGAVHLDNLGNPIKNATVKQALSGKTISRIVRAAVSKGRGAGKVTSITDKLHALAGKEKLMGPATAKLNTTMAAVNAVKRPPPATIQKKWIDEMRKASGAPITFAKQAALNAKQIRDAYNYMIKLNPNLLKTMGVSRTKLVGEAERKLAPFAKTFRGGGMKLGAIKQAVISYENAAAGESYKDLLAAKHPGGHEAIRDQLNEPDLTKDKAHGRPPKDKADRANNSIGETEKDLKNAKKAEYDGESEIARIFAFMPDNMQPPPQEDNGTDTIRRAGDADTTAGESYKDIQNSGNSVSADPSPSLRGLPNGGLGKSSSVSEVLAAIVKIRIPDTK